MMKDEPAGETAGTAAPEQADDLARREAEAEEARRQAEEELARRRVDLELAYREAEVELARREAELEFLRLEANLEAARRDAQARFEQGGDAEPMLESEDGEESEEESSASRRLPRSRGDAGNRLARLSDEVSRLVNSTMHAYLTELRATADVAGALVDAMLPSSSGPGKRPVTSGVNTRKELSSALLEAADRALDIPTEAVDRFYESYHSARRTRSRSRSPARP